MYLVNEAFGRIIYYFDLRWLINSIKIMLQKNRFWKITLVHRSIFSFLSSTVTSFSSTCSWSTTSSTRLSWWPRCVRITAYSNKLVAFFVYEQLAGVTTKSLAPKAPNSVVTKSTKCSLFEKGNANYTYQIYIHNHRIIKAKSCISNWNHSYPVKTFGLKYVAIDLVHFPPSSSTTTIDAS